MPEVEGRVLEGHDVLCAINEVLIPALDEVGAYEPDGAPV